MNYVGLDISADDFAASIFMSVNHPFISKESMPNNSSGFDKLGSWLSSNGAVPENSIVCMEATGVYGEALCYWLVAHNYKLVVEHPLKVKKASTSKSHKTDKIDSQKIAEYAYRHVDKLKFWHPPLDIVEKIKVLLTTREQFVKQKTADTNALKALKRKKVQTPLANKLYAKTIDHLSKNIDRIEKEVQKLIDSNDYFKKTIKDLVSVKSVALLLAANFLVATDGFTNEMATNAKKASSNFGICPFKHQSGTSVFRRPRSKKDGSKRMRKLLYLAAISGKQYNSTLALYAALKKAQGKPGKVILNNIGNKLIRIMCAIVRDGKPYVDNHVSVHPKFA